MHPLKSYSNRKSCQRAIRLTQARPGALLVDALLGVMFLTLFCLVIAAHQAAQARATRAALQRLEAVALGSNVIEGAIESLANDPRYEISWHAVATERADYQLKAVTVRWRTQAGAEESITLYTGVLDGQA